MADDKLDFDYTSWPESIAVMAALNTHGGEARWVGGCVRDALLDRPVNDLDIATTHMPATTMALLDGAGIKAIPTGLQHGTITAICKGRAYEITTLRHDVETDGRHATVAFTYSWQEDAARRDFTMNALYLDAQGQVHDYHDGLIDLASGEVRFIGDARARIAEDVLRILRFFRFTAHYGQPDAPERAGLQACIAMAHKLADLSAERVRVELLKTLAAPDPVPIWQIMLKRGILAPLGLGLEQLDQLDSLVRSALPGSEDALLRMASLLMTKAPDAIATLRDKLRLSNEERDRLLAMADGPRSLSPDHARADLYRMGADGYADLILLRLAEGQVDKPAAQRLLAAAKAWRPVALPLTGQDVIDAGIPPGPEIGRLLRAVETWWVARDFAPDHAACRAYLADLLTS